MTSIHRDTFAGRLLSGIGGKLMQPGRMSTLSMEEEEAGLKAKWKEFDAAMRLAVSRQDPSTHIHMIGERS